MENLYIIDKMKLDSIFGMIDSFVMIVEFEKEVLLKHWMS